MTNKILLVFFILIMIVAILYFVRTVYIGGQIANEIPSEFPVSLKNEVPSHIYASNSGIVVISDVEILFFADDSVEEKSYLHNYANPIAKVAGNRVLTYDQGGYALRVDTKSGNMFELQLENTMLFGEINSAGYIAVVTSDERYTSKLSVYNNNYELIYNYYTNEHIAALDFTSNNECVLIGNKTDNGKMNTALYKLSFDSETEIMEQIIPDFFGLSLDVKSDGSMALISKDKLLLLNEDGVELSEFTFNSPLVNIFDEHDEYTVISVQDIKNPNHTDVHLFDMNGMLINQVTVDGVVDDIKIVDEKIYILTQKNLGIYDAELVASDTVDNGSGLIKITGLDGEIYAISNEFLYKIGAE